MKGRRGEKREAHLLHFLLLHALQIVPFLLLLARLSLVVRDVLLILRV
jgi:hypothetical protein